MQSSVQTTGADTAVRRALVARVAPELDAVEAIYLKEMMNTPDRIPSRVCRPSWRSASPFG